MKSRGKNRRIKPSCKLFICRYTTQTSASLNYYFSLKIQKSFLSNQKWRPRVIPLLVSETTFWVKLLRKYFKAFISVCRVRRQASRWKLLVIPSNPLSTLIQKQESINFLQTPTSQVHWASQKVSKDFLLSVMSLRALWVSFLPACVFLQSRTFHLLLFFLSW